jgi:hypothetical protein
VLYFLREGSADQKLCSSHPVPLDQARAVAPRYGVKHNFSMPAMNPDSRPARWQDSPHHVIVEVSEHETGESFDKAGFYVLIGLAPDQAMELFAIAKMNER